jgi:hypothetical protein
VDKPKVGDLSPKDFHPRSQRLSRFSHFRPSTGSSRLSPTQWWVKALRRNIAYLVIIYLWSVSNKNSTEILQLIGQVQAKWTHQWTF